MTITGCGSGGGSAIPAAYRDALGRISPIARRGTSVAEEMAELPFASIPTPVAGGHTYFVSNSGSDSNLGRSTSSPFKTIGHANNTMAGGDVVVILPGTYREDFCVRKAGTPSNYTTFISEPGRARPIIFGTLAACQGATISVQVPYVRISGLAITRPNETSDTNSGIFAYSPSRFPPTTVHHLLFDGNVLYGCGCAGINANHVDYVRISGNIVYDNSNTAPEQCSGISTYEDVNYDSAAGYHDYITDNISFRNFNKVSGSITKHTTDGEGIIVDSNNALKYTGKVLIAANLVFDNGGPGIEIYDSAYADVVNNTAYANFTDANNADFPGKEGDIEVQVSSTVNVSNNIAQSISEEHKALYQARSSRTTWIHNMSYIGATYSDVNSIGSEDNLLRVDPLFQSPSIDTNSGDFTPKSDSRARKYGVPLSFSFASLSGAMIPAGSEHDAGAYSNGAYDLR